MQQTRRTLTSVFLSSALLIANQASASPCPLSLMKAPLVGGSNLFTFRVLEQMNTENPDKSFVASPLNMYHLLGLILQGTSGRTYTELLDGLGLGMMHVQPTKSTSFLDFQAQLAEKALMANDFQQFARFLKEAKPEGIKISGNVGVWTDPSAPLNSDFERVAREKFAAEIGSTVLSTPAFQNQLNTWVSRETNGMIPKILSQPLDPATIIVLASALYFKGSWKSPFKKEHTMDGDFFKAPGNAVKVPFMSQQLSARSAEIDGARILKLPYGKDEAYSMMIVLPNESETVTSFLRQNVAFSVSDAGFQQQKTVVKLPKFKIESSINDLPKFMREIGLTNTFGSRPDLQALVSGPLAFTQGIHSAVIEVNEEGTEAAAATIIGGTRSVARPPLVFNANRPFLYLVREEATGLILFSGVYRGPADSN